MVTDLGAVHAWNSSNQAMVGVIIKHLINNYTPRIEQQQYKVTIEQGQPADTFIFSEYAMDSDEFDICLIFIQFVYILLALSFTSDFDKMD